MRALLLLFFVLFYCDISNGIELNDCEEAMCYVHTSCHLKSKKPNELDHFKSKGDKCEIGFKIKPFLNNEMISWTISMSYKKDADKSLIWTLYGEEILICDESINKVKFLETSYDNQFSISNPNITGKTCTFTISSRNSETIAEILEKRRTNAAEIRAKIGEYFFTVDNLAVRGYLKCTRESLNEICDSSEHCEKRDIDMETWKCPTEYLSMFKKDKNSNFIEAAEIVCSIGEWVFTTPDVKKGIKFGAGSQSKCAVKKCSLCEAEDNFKSLLQNQTDSPSDNCKILKCPDDYFMVINKEIATGNPVECRDEVAPSKLVDSKNKLLKRNKWIVDNKTVEIETAECRTVTCNEFNKIVPRKCKENDKSCAEPSVHNVTTGMYECKAGYTLHMVNKSGSLEPIGQPTCDTSSTTIQWIVPVQRAKIENIAVNNNLTVTCVKNKVAEANSGKDNKDEPFNGMIVVYVLVPIIIIIAVVCGILCYLKQRRNKSKAAPVPSKTSSSNTSSKPSSTEQEKEKEPLTSAMVSVTAESVHTGVEQTPAAKKVVLANADLRGTTAAASDPSSKKDEKEKKEEEQPLLIPDKKVEMKKKKEEPAAAAQNSDDDDKKSGVNSGVSSKEQVAPFPSAGEDGLKSQTGGDGESQVSTKKNAESAKLQPKGGRGAPRKYSKSSSKASSKKPSNKAFLNVTDDSDGDDEPSRTGSKRRPKKMK